MEGKFPKYYTELEATSSEQLDLLCRYLGNDSSKQAASLRAANFHDENGAVQKIWDRLDMRYGAPELLVSSIRERLDKFPKILPKDTDKLYELSDLVSEISSLKDSDKYKSILSFFDSSVSVNIIVNKLPAFMQNKWTDRALKYKKDYGVVYPPFSLLDEFIKNMAERMNDPSFNFDPSSTRSPSATYTPRKYSASSMHSDRKVNFISRKTVANDIIMCPLHGESSKHSLKDCNIFLKSDIEDKRQIIKKYGICFKCCAGKHLAKDCTETIKCQKCGSVRHCTIFHIDRKTPEKHGGENKEQSNLENENTDVKTKCTQICDNNIGGKSCAKTLLVNVYPAEHPEMCLPVYAIIDDQSNRSLAHPMFFEHFCENYSKIDYVLSSCAGKTVRQGRHATNYILQSFDKTHTINCPSLIECNNIPNEPQEIATPSVVRNYKHLRDLEHCIPEYDPTIPIMLLIGRDVISAHHVLEHRIGLDNEPYAQKLNLGWVIIGETCLGKVHSPATISVKKTHILKPGRESIFEPCPNCLLVKEKIYDVNNIFTRRTDDDKPGLSQEDKEFYKIMEKGVSQLPDGHFCAPLPFKTGRDRLPDNYSHAHRRAENLEKTLKRDVIKQQHFFEFMSKIFEKGHAEKAPVLDDDQERWYLPIFGVYHPKKPSKIRVVFDSSAEHKGVSLNKALLTGPDLTNNLVGILLKFRKERIAVSADIEQMFFNFFVTDKHRDYLRFFWFEENDITKPLIEYRMKVHVFGNSPSPAVATIGLRKSVCGHAQDEDKDCDEVCNFVKHNFYVDDGLISMTNEEHAVSIIKETQKRMLTNGKLKLCKVTSNSSKVLSNFSSEELAPEMVDINFDQNDANVQRSLGLLWQVQSDTFTYRLSLEEKPYTKRGVLSTINSIFDPIGFVAPVVLQGRLVMRKVLSESNLDWDEPLPDKFRNQWEMWRKSLIDLENVKIPRQFTNISFQNSVRKELHVFSDASRDAIGAVVYVKLSNINGDSEVGFVIGKSKVAPTHGHTIPRLELCAAVVATELCNFVREHLIVRADSVSYYTDSQIVLGYINNTSRRFHIYVCNRIDRILKHSTKSQWNYVATECNPADQATRPISVQKMKNSLWLEGPINFLNKCQTRENHELVCPDMDSEVYPEIKTLKTCAPICLGSHRFTRFSKWSALVRAMSTLKKFMSRKQNDLRSNVDFQNESEFLLIKEAQKEYYQTEIDCLKNKKSLPKDSALISLDPALNKHGLLVVGGRLRNSGLSSLEKHPYIVSSKHYIAILLVRHFHEQVKHLGRVFTEGLIRSSGFWIIGGKRLINSVLNKCVKCRISRGRAIEQRMADLPPERLTPDPPFTYVGVDTFGPFDIYVRRTRGGFANPKRWTVVFSCLVTRAIHLEVVEEMSSSSFINAMRRFISIRGPVKEFVSDRGTNFVGATSDLGIIAINVEDRHLQNFLTENKTVWKFNPPHASHMAGAWERMIGLIKRILNSMFQNVQEKQLTHEVLCTFMAEVCAIVNGRPLVSVSTDPDCPEILSPNALLTHKLGGDKQEINDFTVKDVYKVQWKHVQVLADQFWKRWQSEYLHNLQKRQKWQHEHKNLVIGDIVLMSDKECKRNQWSMGTVDKVFPSADGLVRSVSVRTIKDLKPVNYTRPVTKLVYLFSE